MDPTEYTRGSDGNGEAVRAIVIDTREVGDMSLIVDSVLNWPHKFIATSGDLDEITGLFDPDTMCIFYAHLDGSIIMIDDFAPGYSDVGHTINQSLVLKPTTAWADAVAESGGGVGSGIIVSPTPPPDPEEDMFWLDETTEGDAGTNSFVFAQQPTGTVDDANTLFTVQYGSYIAGSLQVFVNGLAQARTIHVSETDPSAGTFTFTTAPATGDVITASYQTSPASANNADTLDNYHLTAILEAIYPVGAIYVSATSSMPALIDGIGTWSRVLGRVIVGLDEGQAEFDAVDETGGANTHSLVNANLPRYNHGVQMHGAGSATVMSGLAGGSAGLSAMTTRTNYRTGGGNTAGANSVDGFSLNIGQTTPDPISNLQPYKVKYMWERTA